MVAITRIELVFIGYQPIVLPLNYIAMVQVKGVEPIRHKDNGF